MMPRITRVIFAGPGASGKTTLIQRYVDGVFNPSTPMTVGFEEHVITLKGEDFAFIDIGGQPQFKFQRMGFYRWGKMVILSLPLDIENPYEKVEMFFKEIIQVIGKRPMILLGTKSDKWDGKNPSEASIVEFKNRLENKLGENIPFIITSAKTGENIEEVMNSVFRLSSL
ncbi:MAG: GTP-binding protein [Candidatus Odinarchaeota archaeon]